MIDSTTADSAPVRIISVDIMFDVERLRVAILHLEMAARLHRSEAEQSVIIPMESHEVRLAWRQANAITAEAIASLNAAFSGLRRREGEIYDAVNETDPALSALGTP